KLLSFLCHNNLEQTQKLLFSTKIAVLGVFRMLTIIDFFRKKGDFRRIFLFQCGIYHTPFVTVLSFGASKRNLRGLNAVFEVNSAIFS
ncbi:MAG: hypothetical protein IJM92_19055, partial [Fibrobacter sp.]|uniref:hypothetical protein n=1 Tax=Fibrobacter sp. TaxID=35828 RepID=UPI0025BF6FC9